MSANLCWWGLLFSLEGGCLLAVSSLGRWGWGSGVFITRMLAFPNQSSTIMTSFITNHFLKSNTATLGGYDL